MTDNLVFLVVIGILGSCTLIAGLILEQQRTTMAQQRLIIRVYCGLIQESYPYLPLEMQDEVLSVLAADPVTQARALELQLLEHPRPA